MMRIKKFSGLISGSSKWEKVEKKREPEPVGLDRQDRQAEKARAMREAKKGGEAAKKAEKAAQPQDNDFGLGALRELCEWVACGKGLL